MGAHRFRHVILLSVLAGLSAIGWSRSEAYTRVYGPKATMLMAQPTLRWEIWPGPGAKITSQKMSINGRDVSARYNVKERALTFTPAEPFAPGNYRVQCRVVIDDSLVANKEWSFSVAPTAAKVLPEPDADQVRALKAANSYRAMMGLPAFQLDNRLNAAALAHSKYLSKNDTTGHFEKPGTPLFFGVEPGDRLESFGYFDESWECVNFGCSNPAESVASLVDAPYHRLPFMQPGEIILGTGFHDNRLTMEFSGGRGQGVVVFPQPGASDVPADWDANERPNPLRLHDTRKPVGYILVFTAWMPEGCKIDVSEATLRSCADGSTVQVFLNTPSNDTELENGCFIIPKKVLRPGTTYEAYVRAEVTPEKKGQSSWTAEKRWRFTTKS
jgi:uncharacterized protein YkwD